MRECYVQLVRPEGSFMQAIIRRDPLGVSSRILARLYQLSSGLGYRMEVKNGHFVHPDGRQVILVFETSAAVTSLDGSHALAQHLRELCAAAPAGVSITPICAQIHTEQNDQLMHRDMNWAGTVDAIGFLLLFLIVCRDWRIAAVFFLPAVTIMIAIGICGLGFSTLSVIVVGLAATMAGSAVDYGIFVYTAIKKGHDPASDIRRIQRHLLISLLTTLGVFVALLFSVIPAYRQLGSLTCVSLILSMLGAVFVLPWLIRPGGTIMGMGSGMPLHRWGKLTVPVMAVAVLLMIVGAILALGVRFDPDLAKLDGVAPSVVQTEKDFQHTWGRSDTELAILAVSASSLDEAERANDQISQLMSAHFAEGQFVTLSSFWPSQATRQANQKRWQAFWTPPRIADLRKNLATAAAPYGFAADAFDPFFAILNSPPKGEQSREILSTIEEQFIARAKGNWQILSYFEDTPENVTTARELVRDRPEAQVISRRALGQAFAESASSETRLLVAISVGFIAVSLLVLTRSIVKSILIMLPAAAGIIAMLALLRMNGMSMSVVSVIAAILVMGLSSDYGIFAVFSWDEHETIFGQGMTSMHLSSITTLIGTSSLLFTKHPALFLVGMSLTSGLVVGYLTAFLVVPGICYLLERANLWSKA
jgi:predicted exporter